MESIRHLSSSQPGLYNFQPRLLMHLETLAGSDRDKLLDQLNSYDFLTLNLALKRALEPEYTLNTQDIQPVPPEAQVDREQLDEQERDRLLAIGLKAVAEGRVCAVVLAGGQASRLGSDRPKGVLPLDTGLVTSGIDSLLFIQAAQIVRLQRMARERFPTDAGTRGGQITWAVMTSQSTEAQTRAHLDTVLQKTGLQWNQVLMFTQKEIPTFSPEGRALLKSPTELVTAPDGNGGMYEAIQPLLPDLESRGVQYLHIYCVDNVLCRVADPLMIGCAIDRGADCTLKVIEKRDPKELVGHVCLLRGRVHVLEYSEIPRELSERCDPADKKRLFLRAGSIANHCITLQLLREICDNARKVLKYHVAHKRIPNWDLDSRQMVQPDQPNGYKLERFIFDPFFLCKKVLVWQVPAAEEFSPLKNADSVGRDCISTCRQALMASHAEWIREACIQCLKDSPAIDSSEIGIELE